jgi:hypothetical protein
LEIRRAVCGARFSKDFNAPPGLVADAGFDPVTEADERDDRGGLHEINVAARAAEQRPGAVAERGRGTERDERVHVGAADFELATRRDKIARRKNLHAPASANASH